MSIKRIQTRVMWFLAAAIMMTASIGFAQQEAATKQDVPANSHKAPDESAAPVTYSQQLRELLKSEDSDAEDRTYGILHNVESHLINIRQQNGQLRAAMVHSSSTTSKSKLAKYEQAAVALNDIKHAVAEIQENLTGCINLCATAEHAAAESRPGPKDLGPRTSKFIANAEAAHKNLQEAVGVLDKLKDQLDDPKLPGMVDYLASESKALGGAIAYSKAHLADIHGEQGEQAGETSKEEKTAEKK